MLAVALAQPSNFLVLDEPTNDLDMDTLDLLQEVLDEYEGTILLVSHDRDFIDRVVTSVIYMPGDGSVSEHAGSYSDLLEKLKSKIPAKKENKKEALPRKEEKPKSETKNRQAQLQPATPAGNSARQNKRTGKADRRYGGRIERQQPVYRKSRKIRRTDYTTGRTESRT